jgi:SAM-dependent methyltransferase/uncharacterized protein YbaR (Trm112 family)
MQRRHFDFFRPICPVCLRAGSGEQRLLLASVFAEQDGDVRQGILHCSLATCRHEYPILDGIPIVTPNLRRHLSDRAVELLVRDDIDPDLEGLFGDAMGPDSWFDVLRQTLSTYGWDAFGDQDPAEPPSSEDYGPGAARRCLAELLRLAPPAAPVSRALDLGCAAGGTSFALAAALPDALVLGLDMNLSLLRLARRAAGGEALYPRRRVGLVYDRRRFKLNLPAADRVDFWACDATCLPFSTATADLAVALNLLDCVADPPALLAVLAQVLRPGGQAMLATPYDWSTRATQPEGWIGGHSQRGPHAGAAEPLLHLLLAGQGWLVRGERAHFPWHTRLHDRSTVSYDAHLLALARPDG